MCGLCLSICISKCQKLIEEPEALAHAEVKIYCLGTSVQVKYRYLFFFQLNNSYYMLYPRHGIRNKYQHAYFVLSLILYTLQFTNNLKRIFEYIWAAAVTLEID